MASIWLNEIDYDQPGIDAASFIEFKGSGTLDLSAHAVVLINGSSNTAYMTISLASAGVQSGDDWFVVVGNDGITLPSGTFIPVGTGDFIQNGAPDGVALIDTASGTVVEYWSYEGSIKGTAFAGVSGLYDAAPMVDYAGVSSGDTNLDLGGQPIPMSLVRSGAHLFTAVQPVVTPGADDPDYTYSANGMSLGANASVVEGNGAGNVMTFKVMRSDATGAASADWSLGFSGSADASDFLSTSGSITFKDGQTTVTIKVQVVADSVAEANEGFSINLSNAIGADIIKESASGAILNDDASSGDDALTGTKGADAIDGLAGSDTINGGGGDDILTGGLGMDRLTGGLGADTFDFNAAAESLYNADVFSSDTITDFVRSQGDKIDLSTIDANAIADGDQSFTLVKSGFTSVAGQLLVVKVSGSTLVYGDVDGDGAADFSILAAGTRILKAADFIL